MLEFTYIAITDIFINATGNGRIKIDGINGSRKSYLGEKMCMIGSEESNNERTIMNSASMIGKKKK